MAEVPFASNGDCKHPFQVVLVMCGIPGSGKSHLSKLLLHNFVGSMHIEYDVMETKLLQEQQQEEIAFSPAIWKESRAKSLDVLQKALRARSGNTHDGVQLFVLDDNFYLRSMRREVFKVCQDYVMDFGTDSLYFCIIWKETEKEVCIERNNQRQAKVPHDVIERMYSSLEPPRAWWESHVLRITSDDDGENIQSVKEFLSNFRQHGNPVLSPRDDSDRIEEERRKTRESMLHAWDNLLRSWVGQVAKIRREDVRNANAARKEILQLLKRPHDDIGKDLVANSKVITEWFMTKTCSNWSKMEQESFIRANEKQVEEALFSLGVMEQS